MWRRLTIITTMAILAQGANVPLPSQLYIVSQFFSDYGPSLYYRVTEVVPDGRDTIVRYTRIANSNIFCPRRIVQSVEARLRNRSPADLIKGNNPCAVKSEDLRTAVRKYSTIQGTFETIRFGIEAQCGSSSVVLGLPISQSVDMKRLNRAEPKMARLWYLVSDIDDPVFGSKDIFHDRTEADDAALQFAGQRIASELASGKYDAGLAAAAGVTLGDGASPTFRGLLENYRGPVTALEANAGYVPELLNAASYRFSTFVTPEYPRIAMTARIQGRVKLRLTVELSTGEVKAVEAVEGNRLLQPSALAAAKLWRFEPQSTGTEPLGVTLDYALHCQ
jgi:TonB family protein